VLLSIRLRRGGRIVFDDGSAKHSGIIIGESVSEFPLCAALSYHQIGSRISGADVEAAG
jgi:hypothetical protein